MDVNEVLYRTFWVGAVATIIGVVAIGVVNAWHIAFTFLLAYVAGGVVGCVALDCQLRVPSIRRQYDAQPVGMGYGISLLDLFVPYLVAGILAALAITPLAIKRQQILDARKHRIASPVTSDTVSPTDSPQTKDQR